MSWSADTFYGWLTLIEEVLEPHQALLVVVMAGLMEKALVPDYVTLIHSQNLLCLSLFVRRFDLRHHWVLADCYQHDNLDISQLQIVLST